MGVMQVDHSSLNFKLTPPSDMIHILNGTVANLQPQIKSRRSLEICSLSLSSTGKAESGLTDFSASIAPNLKVK